MKLFFTAVVQKCKLLCTVYLQCFSHRICVCICALVWSMFWPLDPKIHTIKQWARRDINSRFSLSLLVDLQPAVRFSITLFYHLSLNLTFSHSLTALSFFGPSSWLISTSSVKCGGVFNLDSSAHMTFNLDIWSMKLVRKSSHVEKAYIDTVPVTGHPLDWSENAHFQCKLSLRP